MAGIALFEADGIQRNVHRHAVPRAWWPIQPEHSVYGRECQASAWNFQHQQRLEFSVGCENDSGGPAVLLEKAHPSRRAEPDIIGGNLKRHLLPYI